MVTHAFLITAYRDWSTLERLIEQLLNVDGSLIYINIDARRPVMVEQALELGLSLPSGRVTFKTDATVRWGGFRHLDVLMQLAEQAASEGADRFHTMTGQCRLTVSPSDFITFFEKNSAKNYLENFALPYDGWNLSGGLDRLRYFHLHDVLDLKTSLISKVFAFAFLRFQKLLRVDRRRENVSYFGGSGYYSLNRPAMDYFLTEYHAARKQYRHTYCAEEVAPQTLLCNAPPEIRSTLVNDNLRFVLWQEKFGEMPAILDERDAEAIGKSNALFARKFDSRFSQKLASMFP